MTLTLPTEATQNIESFAAWCEKQGIDTVIPGTADTNGAWIGKRVPLGEFVRMAGAHGVPYCDVLFAITRNGLENIFAPEDKTTYFPTHKNGYPDIFLRPDLASARVLSWHERTIMVNGIYHLPTGEAVPITPRHLLTQARDRLRALGYEPYVASEFEFYVSEGTPDELRAKNWELQPISGRPYTYQVFRSSLDQEFLSRWQRHLQNAGIHIEALNPETGPGQYELNSRYTDALRAADDAFLYKNGIKELAAMEGRTASFMALPRAEWAGSSCHIHQSLRSINSGEPVMMATEAEGGEAELSEVGKHYTAGVLATLRDFAAIYWPTVNSYRRSRPYSWSATTVSWGWDNRSTALRVVGEDADSVRLENRMPGADVNPYLAIAATLAGGAYGIENQLELPDPTRGDAYANPELESLPGSLEEAVDILEQSELAREIMGADFVVHYVTTLRAEIAQWKAHVSDWEVGLYFESA
ncbi:glutamine synthetase family protein [Brevibacterium aurantiacum]|uniref:glutamine synthetase family protein n=1 Tax=Brevibacterium aurantiacum TaxID=273384 RepID=UPI001866CB4B|nr:glutamine synthetase family protein [Brevibacterium aurantiacum]